MKHPAEISWFSALCDDDYEFLGVPDPALASSLAHCRDIVMRAEKGGFDNILLPSGYALGIDSLAFAGAVAPLLKHMQLLVAVRCAEMWPPQLARQLATLDHMLHGRLTVNIISSDLPGETLESSPPPFYFGGLSDDAREVAAKAADVFLMWPDRIENIRTVLDDMRRRASSHGRLLRFGYRVHVIVRETEAEARAAARRLMSRLDDATGEEIRKKSLDASSFGVRRQAEMRDEADEEGFVEDNLWTGIGRARSGCGAAIVGDPDQVLKKIETYRSLGLDAFIFSGYPHAEECDLFARYVLPKLDHAPLFSRGH